MHGRILLDSPADNSDTAADACVSGQFNVAPNSSNVAADHRGSLNVRISSNHTDIAADLSVSGQFNVAADNNEIAADSPFQSQIVAYDQQVSHDLLVFTDPHVAAEHGYVALHVPDTDFVSPLSGLCEQKYERSQREDKNERCPASQPA